MFSLFVLLGTYHAGHHPGLVGSLVSTSPRKRIFERFTMINTNYTPAKSIRNFFLLLY
jgi:hypothetical protein